MYYPDKGIFCAAQEEKNEKDNPISDDEKLGDVDKKVGVFLIDLRNSFICVIRVIALKVAAKVYRFCLSKIFQKGRYETADVGLSLENQHVFSDNYFRVISVMVNVGP